MDVMVERKKKGKGMQGIYFVDLKVVIYKIKDFFFLIILYYI